jgi:hypothetical protein
VQTVPTSEALVSLDLSDPSAPRLVQELKLGENYRPHWMAADRSGSRIVVTGRGDMQHRVLLVDSTRSRDRWSSTWTFETRALRFQGYRSTELYKNRSPTFLSELGKCTR